MPVKAKSKEAGDFVFLRPSHLSPQKGIRDRRWDFSGRQLAEGLEQADKD